MEISKNDRELLRFLAEKYMKYALCSENAEKKRLWLKLNSLNPERPLFTMDQLPWDEMDVDGSLVCRAENPYFRDIENELRRQIYKWEHMRADMVLNPYILLPRFISNSGFGIRAEAEKVGETVKYKDILPEPEDIEKIKTPVISVDREAEADAKATAEEIFTGIAPVKFQGIISHCGIWDWIAQWRGAENCYYDLIDRPEFIHALMERLTEAVLSMTDRINELGLYDINTNMCHCSYTYSNTLPSEKCDTDNPTTYDGWAFGMAQLFTSVSPAMTAEFEIPYMQRIFPRFGSVYYGCCDRLDDRLELVSKLPNVKKISCSPWSDRENFASRIDRRYIMSAKPSPAFLATDSFDVDAVRKDLRRTIDAARRNGVTLELLLKDVTTVRNDPSRLWRWSEIALEEAMR